MTSIYIREQGTRVGRRGERLQVSRKGRVVEEFPIVHVDQVVLFGNIQLTTQAVAMLLANDVDVVFLSAYGKFRGRLNGLYSKNARLRHNQLIKMADDALALSVAQAIVDGKIHNQRTILQRQAGRLRSLRDRATGRQARPANPRLFRRGLAGMQEMQRGARQAATLDSLRGYEGKAGAYYFEAIRSLLAPEWGFERRAYHPPPDPFNALISFGYSLLLKDVFAAVEIVGLDPYLGFFHAIDYGRPSLALDLMEEWRPIVVDSLALALINRRQLQPDDFRRTGKERRPVELGEDGVRLVITAYEERLESKLYHPAQGPGGQTTLRRAIGLQVRQVAQLLQDKVSQYEPYRIR